MLGGRKVRSNKGKKRGPYKARTRRSRMMITVSTNGTRNVRTRKVRSNKGKKRTPYGTRTGVTRSGRKFRGGARTVSLGDKTSDKQLGMSTKGAALQKYIKNNCRLIEYNPGKGWMSGGLFSATGIKVKNSMVYETPKPNTLGGKAGIQGGWKLHLIGNANTSTNFADATNKKIDQAADKQGWDTVQTLLCEDKELKLQ